MPSEPNQTTPRVNTADWQGVDLDDPSAVLRRALELYHPHIALASSFGLEDVALIDMVAAIRPDVRIFSLDTGRLNPETYECADRIYWKYKIPIEWYFPKHEAVEGLVGRKGLFSFRESVENRKECCFIRKVEPLSRALRGMKAWITGLRQEQSLTRSALDVLEVDHVHGDIVKINPLARWSLGQVREYVDAHQVPYNKLHDRGYPSIGCAPCTRAIQAGEDERAGRWWWENADSKECGLHVEHTKGLHI
jgi:phosphoadenosine phosphosulfate reductase